MMNMCQLWLGCSPLFSWRSNFTHWHPRVSRFDWSWYPRCAPRHPNGYENLYPFRLQHHPNWKLSASFVGSQNQCGTFVPWTCHQVCFQFPHSVFLRTWHQLLFFVFSVFGEVKPFEERRARHLDDALYLVYTGAAWKRVTIPNCSMNYFLYSLPWMVGHYRLLFYFPFGSTIFLLTKTRVESQVAQLLLPNAWCKRTVPRNDRVLNLNLVPWEWACSVSSTTGRRDIISQSLGLQLTARLLAIYHYWINQEF